MGAARGLVRREHGICVAERGAPGAHQHDGGQVVRRAADALQQLPARLALQRGQPQLALHAARVTCVYGRAYKAPF